MKKKKIIEAWRNEDYYLCLSDEERAALPEHPSGITGVEEIALRSVTGGCGPTGSSICSPCPPYWCN